MQTETTAPPKKQKRHWFFRTVRALGLLVLLAVIAYFVADQIAYRSFLQQQEAFREQFGKLEFQEFIPERPPADEDAGRLYRYAAGLMAEVDAEHGDWSVYGALTDGPASFERRGRGGAPLPTQDELDVMVEEKMIAMADAFAAVEEARALERGSIITDYTASEEMLATLTEVRQLARNIAAKAVYEARAGDLDAAFAWLESGVHLAATLNNEPTLLIQMVRIALVELATDSAEVVFNTTEAPLPLTDRYWTLLERVSDPAVFANGLAGEMGYSLSLMSNGPYGPRIVRSLGGSKMMGLYMRLAEIVQIEPSPERRARVEALAGESEGGNPFHIFARMMVPNLLRSVQQFEHVAVRCDFVRIAAALRAYKSEHGSYPESLNAVTSMLPDPLPLDPFTGGPLQYRTAGEGFTLYSVGPDGVNDGGASMEDIVWAAGR